MIKLIQGDITKIHSVEAIVNAANRTLLGGGGVDWAIHKAAGIRLFTAGLFLGGCKTGNAKITKAYKLPCEYVIHAVGPVWKGGGRKEDELLASCYHSSLELAVEHGIRNIAFPSISTGIYSFPVERAAGIALHTAKEFLREHPGKMDLVMWVLFNDSILEAYQKQLGGLEWNERE